MKENKVVINIGFLLLSILIFLIGCNKSTVIGDNNKIDELLVKEIQETIPAATNINILKVKDFSDTKKIVLYSYDIPPSEHFVDYNFFYLRNEKVILEGGAGGSAEKAVPISVSSANAQPDNYLITYGEINNKDVKKIKISYADGVEFSEDVSTSLGYLFIRKNYSTGFKKIEAYNVNNELIFHLP